MALKAKSLATATTTATTTSGCPTNRPIATTFHLELTSQQSAAHADSQWSYGFVVCVSRACDLEHRHMCQKCRYAVVLFLDVSFAHSSARLGSLRLGLAWRLLLRGLSLGFFSDKKKKGKQVWHGGVTYFCCLFFTVALIPSLFVYWRHKRTSVQHRGFYGSPSHNDIFIHLLGLLSKLICCYFRCIYAFLFAFCFA